MPLLSGEVNLSEFGPALQWSGKRPRGAPLDLRSAAGCPMIARQNQKIV
jgi:hypothetical protein